jgi:RNA polymerase sigma-70 factor (ECF subfamily)
MAPQDLIEPDSPCPDEGPGKAFAALYRETSAPKLFGDLPAYPERQRGEAEEALQEVYRQDLDERADRFAAWRPAARWPGSPRSRATTRSTSSGRGARWLSDLDAAYRYRRPAHVAGSGGGRAQVASDERQRILGCLDELDNDRAAAVRGAYLNGDSYLELAERFSVPLNTMRTWLRRSLMKLKECLER